MRYREEVEGLAFDRSTQKRQRGELLLTQSCLLFPPWNKKINHRLRMMMHVEGWRFEKIEEKFE